MGLAWLRLICLDVSGDFAGAGETDEEACTEETVTVEVQVPQTEQRCEEQAEDGSCIRWADVITW